MKFVVLFYSSHVQFGLDSPEQIQQEAHIRVVSKNLYSDGRQPVPYGVLDRQMVKLFNFFYRSCDYTNYLIIKFQGISQKDALCTTCNQGLNECVGHFGYLDLALPVFHVGHFRSTIQILQSICKTCARVMLKDADKTTFGRRLMNPNLSYLAKKSITSQILAKSKKNTKCPHCGAINGPVKKGPGLMKILHEPFRGKKSTDPIMSETLGELREATSKNRELNQILGPHALISELNPLQVLDIFKRIPKSDIPLLGMTSKNANPSNLIVTRVFVPPVCIRPSVVSETKAGTTEDDLTMKQSEILLINDVINKHMSTGGKIELVQEDWEFLQLHVSLYFNSEVSGIPLAMLVRD